MTVETRHAASRHRELSRKAIHVAASIAAACIAARAPAAAGRAILLGAFLVAATVELARHVSPAVHRLFGRVVGEMLRTHEARGVTGATTLAAGFAIAVLAVPPRFAATGILAAGLGDAAAALVGRRYGRRRTRAGKSLEGSAAGFLVAFLTVWAMPGSGPLAAVAVATLTTLLEALPLPFDDNLLLPCAASLVTWVANVVTV